VYDAGVRLGARKEWEFMWKRYQNETVAEEKRKLLSSLSSTREAWLLQRLVNLGIGAGLSTVAYRYSLDSYFVNSCENPRIATKL
jgi:hypothetical protein